MFGPMFVAVFKSKIRAMFTTMFIEVFGTVFRII